MMLCPKTNLKEDFIDDELYSDVLCRRCTLPSKLLHKLLKANFSIDLWGDNSILDIATI